jgi:hypothetical protein
MCDFLSSWDNWDYSLITAEVLLIIIGIFFCFIALTTPRVIQTL